MIDANSVELVTSTILNLRDKGSETWPLITLNPLFNASYERTIQFNVISVENRLEGGHIPRNRY